MPPQTETNNILSKELIHHHPDTSNWFPAQDIQSVSPCPFVYVPDGQEVQAEDPFLAM